MLFRSEVGVVRRDGAERLLCGQRGDLTCGAHERGELESENALQLGPDRPLVIDRLASGVEDQIPAVGVTADIGVAQAGNGCPRRIFPVSRPHPSGLQTMVPTR